MNKLSVIAVNERGRLALRQYCDKFRKKRPFFGSSVIKRVLPFNEEVDSLDNPSILVVRLGKAVEAQAFVLIPKIQKSVINILGKFGGCKDDFEVKIE